MPYRLTKIYTRKGDQGYTHLRDQRLSKDDCLVEVIGDIDELNASIGFIISLQMKNKEIEAGLTQIQHQLFNMGGELHLPERIAITADNVAQLEKMLDAWNATLPPLKEFVLPRGNMACAAAHMSRTICRRAERSLVRLHRQTPLSNLEMLRYLNRLSDLLFVIARILGQEDGEKEILWEHERKK